jgi:hypothetical protein
MYFLQFSCNRFLVGESKSLYGIQHSSFQLPRAVPPTVKRVLRANELALWPLFVHYVHNELLVPTVSKGSNAHRKKSDIKHNYRIHQSFELSRESKFPTCIFLA